MAGQTGAIVAVIFLMICVASATVFATRAIMLKHIQEIDEKLKQSITETNNCAQSLRSCESNLRQNNDELMKKVNDTTTNTEKDDTTKKSVDDAKKSTDNDKTTKNTDDKKTEKYQNWGLSLSDCPINKWSIPPNVYNLHRQMRDVDPVSKKNAIDWNNSLWIAPIPVTKV